jgi:hypothetical protein
MMLPSQLHDVPCVVQRLDFSRVEFSNFLGGLLSHSSASLTSCLDLSPSAKVTCGGFTFDAAFLIRILCFFLFAARSQPPCSPDSVRSLSSLFRDMKVSLWVCRSHVKQNLAGGSERNWQTVRLEPLATVTVHVSPCRMLRSFGGTYCLHLQGGMVSETSSKFSLCLPLDWRVCFWSCVLASRLCWHIKKFYIVSCDNIFYLYI